FGTSIARLRGLYAMGDEDAKPCRRSLLRVGDGLALSLGALGRCPRGGSLPFLYSTVRAHGSRLSGLPSPDKGTISAVVVLLLSVAYAYQVGARSIAAGRCPAAQTATGAECHPPAVSGHPQGGTAELIELISKARRLAVLFLAVALSWLG